eukprot:TRINITY_DN34965_c0_g1_i1.p2 TRINITY_DN34965_c0_g1~~TRINITY_DN34965_c0_g1_i1.p2  ORF type:complete len:114 (+),score=18.38 TRINITY_DN34965_c0_g1_i1:80-421(+)
MSDSADLRVGQADQGLSNTERIERLERTTEWLLQALEDDRTLFADVVREMGEVTDLLAENRSLVSVQTPQTPMPTPSGFFGFSPSGPPDLNALITDDTVAFVGSAVPINPPSF